MPVVGRGNEDGVDVGPREDFAEIAVGGAAGVRAGGVAAVAFLDPFLLLIAAAESTSQIAMTWTSFSSKRPLTWPPPWPPVPMEPMPSRFDGAGRSPRPSAEEDTM